MSQAAPRVRRKWRPSLGLLVTTVLGLVLSLAAAGLFLFQFYASQLIQQTEESLLAQGAVLAEAYAERYSVFDDAVPRGQLAPPGLMPDAHTPFLPLEPTLSLAQRRIPSSRPDAKPAPEPPDLVYREIAPALTAITDRAQARNLAGYAFLDDQGQVIAGTTEIGLSLAHIPEVAAALSGRIVSLLRHRQRDKPAPPVYSISRGTSVRVFVALPVVVKSHGEDRVIGAVYLNRTPSNIVRYIHSKRWSLIWAGFVVLMFTALIGSLFWRFVSRPLHGLIGQVDRIAEGDPGALAPLPHYGTSEVAKLGRTVLNMAQTLTDRQQAVQTFTAHVTHELKSPLTSVTGAAELLIEQIDRMTEAERNRFLSNIAHDSQRMTRLLERLRDLAAARLPTNAGEARLSDVSDGLTARFAGLALAFDGGNRDLPMTEEALKIALTHLIENSAAHQATQVTITAAQDREGAYLDIADNGEGISAANRAKILEPFFTTRRDAGGTGMGLSIVDSMLAAQGGRIEALDQAEGATIRLRFGDG